MRFKRIVAPAVIAMGSFCGGCKLPEEPTAISSSIESVSVVELLPPGMGKGIQLFVRLAAADGANIELWRCSVALERFDDQRWVGVDGQICSLPAGVEPDTYPVVDGILTARFAAPSTPGQYRLVAGVRRAGRKELIPVRAQFELSLAQTR